VKYRYDLVGNRLGRQVNVVNDSQSWYPGEVLSTRYTDTLGNPYYDDGDRLRKEYDLSSAIFSALGGEANRIYAYADGTGGFGIRCPAVKAGSVSWGLLERAAVDLGSRSADPLYGIDSICSVWAMLAQQWRRIRGTVTAGPRPTLSLYHRCLCVLLAYIFLIGPETLCSWPMPR